MSNDVIPFILCWLFWDLKLLLEEGLNFFSVPFSWMSRFFVLISVALFRPRTDLNSCRTTPHHLQGSMLNFGSLKVLILWLEQLISVNATDTNCGHPTFHGFLILLIYFGSGGTIFYESMFVYTIFSP